MLCEGVVYGLKKKKVPGTFIWSRLSPGLIVLCLVHDRREGELRGRVSGTVVITGWQYHSVPSAQYRHSNMSSLHTAQESCLEPEMSTLQLHMDTVLYMKERYNDRVHIIKQGIAVKCHSNPGTVSHRVNHADL